MVTDLQSRRFWADTGTSYDVFDYGDIDDIFEEAAEQYSDDASITAATRVIGIQRLLASSAKLTSYRQNASSENASDIFKHLNQLLERWEGRLQSAVAASKPAAAARFGSTRRIPPRIKEYPDG